MHATRDQLDLTSSSAPDGDRPDIRCVLQDRLPLSDVSVKNCCADTYVDTAAATGSAAEGRAAKKVAKYALREPGGYDFTPLVVEWYGYQCTLLNLLGRLAADSGVSVRGRGSRVRCGD